MTRARLNIPRGTPANTVGALLLVGQLVLQSVGKEVNALLVTAGTTLLGTGIAQAVAAKTQTRRAEDHEEPSAGDEPPSARSRREDHPDGSTGVRRTALDGGRASSPERVVRQRGSGTGPMP